MRSAEYDWKTLVDLDAAAIVDGLQGPLRPQRRPAPHHAGVRRSPPRGRPRPGVSDDGATGGTALCTQGSQARTAFRLLHGHGEQDQARRHQGDGPEEIEVDPGAAQEGDANPLVDNDSDDGCHAEHRERMNADGRQRDLD